MYNTFYKPQLYFVSVCTTLNNLYRVVFLAALRVRGGGTITYSAKMQNILQISGNCTL